MREFPSSAGEGSGAPPAEFAVAAPRPGNMMIIWVSCDEGKEMMPLCYILFVVWNVPLRHLNLVGTTTICSTYCRGNMIEMP